MKNLGLFGELKKGESQLCWQWGMILETDNIINLSFVWWAMVLISPWMTL
jgi:hypothetical protein